MPNYEYVAVGLPTIYSNTRDRRITEELNKVAKHGWRLKETLFQNGSHTSFAIFEREATDSE